MRVEITKRSDGSGLLRCTRDDGSVSWQKQTARQAPHFALHDLTHFAVESALRFENAFFGLIAQGWEIEDTTGKGSRGPLRAEALEVEALVGTFDSERAAAGIWSAAEFNEMAALNASSNHRPAPRKLCEDDLARIRTLRAALFTRWRELPAGSSLELVFECPSRLFL